MIHRSLRDAVLASLCAIGAAAAQCTPAWQPIAPAPVPPTVWALATMPNGDVIAGGVFSSIGGVAASNIARWDGRTWAPLGSGVNGWVNTLLVAPNGDLVVGGAITIAGGAPAAGVARWDGAAWAAFGAGVTSAKALAMRSNGDLLAVVGGGVMRWDGASWAVLPGFSGQHLRGLLTLENDDVLVLGDGYLPASGPAAIALWDGVAFSALGGTTYGEAKQAIVRRNGDLVVAGNNLSVDVGSTPILQFTRAGWLPLDPQLTGTVYALVELPNGDLLAAGSLLLAGQPLGSVCRWNGGAWTVVGSGLGGHANDLALAGNGELFAAGAITLAGSFVYMAQTTVPCPASVLSVGSGCVSTAGPVTLATADRPWAGATFAATATGMTSQSLAVQVLGLQTVALPLPYGAPGCVLQVDPIVTGLVVPAAGVAGAELEIPDSPSLVGGGLLMQVVGIELDASLQIGRMSGSNALRLMIGAL